jgi:soluble lytic murein transglycosylase-like protein
LVATFATLALAGAVRPAFSAERVLLANGFDMRCDHHSSVDGRVRLYMTAGEGNYIEQRPENIVRFEQVSDPPAASVAASGPKKNEKLTPADLHEMFAQAGENHNIDADLLASVVKAESNGNARAVSHAGARGLMQLMPKTAAEEGVNDSFQPDENVRGGSAYLDELLVRYHNNLAFALAAYNAGPAAVDKYHGIPPYHETRTYVARVIHEFNRCVQAREMHATSQARRAQSATAVLQVPSSR